MADKRLNDLTPANDLNYVYAEDANGNQVKVLKSSLASVVAGNLNAVTHKGSVEGRNLNDITATGSYTLEKATNAPKQIYARLVVIQYASSGFNSITKQEWFGLFDGTYYVRYQRGDADWTSWKQII